MEVSTAPAEVLACTYDLTQHMAAGCCCSVMAAVLQQGLAKQQYQLLLQLNMTLHALLVAPGMPCAQQQHRKTLGFRQPFSC